MAPTGWLHRSRLGERAGEPGPDGQVGVELDAVQAPDPQRQRAPLVLEATVLPLDRAAQQDALQQFSEERASWQAIFEQYHEAAA